MKLGVEDTVKISAARQLYGIGKARYDAKYLPGDKGEIFGLETFSEDDTASKNKEGDDIIKAFRAQVVTARADVMALSLPTPLTPMGDCLDHDWRYKKGCSTGCLGDGAEVR